MIVIDILVVLAITYGLYKICFPKDFTEVDAIFLEERQKENDK